MKTEQAEKIIMLLQSIDEKVNHHTLKKTIRINNSTSIYDYLTQKYGKPGHNNKSKRK